MEEWRVLATVRRWLQILIIVGALGMATDLLLIHHIESPQQFIPLAALAFAVVCVAWQMKRASAAATLTCRLAMGALIAAGAAGALLHYEGSAAFQRESDPSVAGWPLMRKVLESKAPPVLAPGNMALLGLVGLVSTYGMSVPGGRIR